MIDWDKLRVFHAVAQAASFTRAGEALNLSQSALSRQVAGLEENLKTELFHRNARGLTLTEQGEILYKTVCEIFSKLASTENALLDSRERPRGPFKLAAPVDIGTTWLTPQMREFCDIYPEIDVTLLTHNREFDLTKREADAAIRLYPAKHPDLIQKRLTTLHHSVYASREYLRLYGTPQTLADLRQHKLIAFSEESPMPFADVNWLLAAAGNIKPAFTISSLFGMQRAVKSGIGLAGLPDYMGQGKKSIVKILPDVKGPATEVYFIYPIELRNSKRVRAFKEFLVRKLEEEGLAEAA